MGPALLADLRDVRPDDLGNPDLLVGGTPCQAFSPLGQRGGLGDERGRLTPAFARLWRRSTASVMLWENVPGVLTAGGAAFAELLSVCSGADASARHWHTHGVWCGPDGTVAWRVLDAQHFGTAQRRRRVFVVASKRGGPRPQDVLFERSPGDLFGSQRGPAPNNPIVTRLDAMLEREVDERHYLSPRACRGVLRRLGAGSALPPALVDALRRGAGERIPRDRSAPDLVVACGPAPCLGTRHGFWRSGDLGRSIVAWRGRARGLTPTEYERLQGFADGYTTLVGLSDAARIAMVGNSMAVPVMRWLGSRIARALGGPFTFASVCAGIEAASVAWCDSPWSHATAAKAQGPPVGARATAFVEIAERCRRLLRERWSAR